MFCLPVRFVQVMRKRLQDYIGAQKQCSRVWKISFSSSAVIIYNILLWTSVSLHTFLAEAAGVSWHCGSWQVTWAAMSLKSNHKSSVSWCQLPLTARNAACVCCQTPRHQMMPPRPKLRPAAWILSRQPVVSSEFHLSGDSLFLHHNFGSKVSK